MVTASSMISSDVGPNPSVIHAKKNKEMEMMTI